MSITYNGCNTTVAFRTFALDPKSCEQAFRDFRENPDSAKIEQLH